MLANAGHFDVEISLAATCARWPPAACARCCPLVEQYDARRARGCTCSPSGRVVNLAAAEGHPAAVMDVSFARPGARRRGLRPRRAARPGVHAVPAQIDREVARLKLASLRGRDRRAAPDQEQYLRSWAPGRWVGSRPWTGCRQSIEKMRADGVSDAAIETFRDHYTRWQEGETGLLPEAEIEPVGDLPDARRRCPSPATTRTRRSTRPSSSSSTAGSARAWG